MKEENKLKNMFLKMETIKQTEYEIILLEEPAPQVKWNVLFKWFLGLKLSKNPAYHATVSLKRIIRFPDDSIAEGLLL